MPLNVQISYRYSRFLDLHVYNMRDGTSSASYKLVTNLAYKDHSTFTYTPETSNIHQKYKTSVVPISLHRAFTRCSDMRDTNHHISFMKRMVQTRKQNPDEVQRKLNNFFKKRRLIKPSKEKKLVETLTTPVMYDNLSKQHMFVDKLCRDSFGDRIQVVYKSRNKVASVLCPKRKTIKALTQLMKK